MPRRRQEMRWGRVHRKDLTTAESWLQNLRADASSENRPRVNYIHLLRVTEGSVDTRRWPRSPGDGPVPPAMAPFPLAARQSGQRRERPALLQHVPSVVRRSHGRLAIDPLSLINCASDLLRDLRAPGFDLLRAPTPALES